MSTPSLPKTVPLSCAGIYPWIAWGISVSFVVFQLYIQLSSGVLLHAIMQDFMLNPLEAGALSAAFYLSYIVLQIPAGILMDQWGPKYLISLGAATCSIACLLFAGSHSFFIAFCARLLMGAGSACAFISTVHIASNHFPKHRLALLVGLAETSMMLGTWMSEVSLAHVLDNIHWRAAMYFSALIAAVIALLSWQLIHSVKRKTSYNQAMMKQNVRYLLRQKSLWANGLYIGFLFSCVTAFASLWCIPFIALAQEISLSHATLECGFIFLGVAVGSPVLGLLFHDYIESNTLYFITAVAALLVVMLLVYYTPKTVSIGALYFFFLGLLSSVTVLNYTRASHAVPVHMNASVTGFSNTLALLIIPILQVGIGGLLHVVSAETHYTLTDYRIALSLMPIILTVAMMLCWWMQSDHSLRSDDTEIAQKIT